MFCRAMEEKTFVAVERQKPVPKPRRHHTIGILASAEGQAKSEHTDKEGAEKADKSEGKNGAERRKSVEEKHETQQKYGTDEQQRNGTIRSSQQPTKGPFRQQKNAQRNIGRPKVEGKRLPMVGKWQDKAKEDQEEKLQKIGPNSLDQNPSVNSDQNQTLLEELLHECLSPQTAEMAELGERNGGTETEEGKRPRFSLDCLVPPQLFASEGAAITQQHSAANVSASFSLKRHPSVEIACHGTVRLIGAEATAQAEDQRMVLSGRTVADAAVCTGGSADSDSSTPTTASPSLTPRFDGFSRTDSPRQRMGISLLERLVKCHPIWFLPHLNRHAVAHLLTAQPPGVFIVRASSRGVRSSFGTSPIAKRRVEVMALSVRLPTAENGAVSGACEQPELDHFLIEAVGTGTAVRLEGSPYTFNSLPLLLEHYSLEGEGELKVRLALPQTLAFCESIQTLQGMSLMGQDFWTSPLSGCCPTSCASSSSSFPSPSSLPPPPPAPLPKPVPLVPMVLYNPMTTFGQQQRSRAVHSPSSVKSSASSPAQFFRSPPHPPTHFPPPPPSPTPSSSTTFLHCPSSSVSMEHFSADHHRHHCCFCCSPCPSNQPHCHGHVPLRKSHSVHGRPLNAPSSRGCAWERDGPPPPSPRSLREGRVGNGGFLRGLFSPSPQRKHSSTNRTTTSGRRRTMARNEVYGTLWEEPELNNGNNSSSDWLAHQQHILFAREAEEQQKSGKSFFARLKGFKRTNSTFSLGSKREDTNGLCFDDSSGTLTQMRPEVLRARQLAFRRTNTDTGGGAIASALVRLKALNERTPQTAEASSSRNNICERPTRNFNFPLARVLPQPRKTNANREREGEETALTMAERQRGEEKERKTPAEETAQQKQNFAIPSAEEICSASSLQRRGGNSFSMNRNKSDLPHISLPINRLLQQKGTTMDAFPISGQHLSTTSNRLRQSNAMEVLERRLGDENLGWKKANDEHRNSTSTTNSSRRTSKTAIAAVRPQLKQMQLNGISTKLRKAPDVPTKAHSSDYSLLGEMFPHRKNSDQRNSGEIANSQLATDGNVDETARHGLIMADEDDQHSLAGTDFNEPWDSNAWENLMDLARFGDGPVEESPRASQIENDSLTMMEKAAKMVNCSRTQIPHFTAGEHRRSLLRMHGTNSMMDISGIGSNKLRHPISAEAANEPMRTNGLNFGQSSIGKQQQQRPHRPVPACSSSVDELNAQPNKVTSICPSLVPVFLPSRLRNLAHEHPGEEDPAKVIQRYVEDLSKDDQTLFEAALHQFIECTLLSKEKDPYVVIRRVRQFITGMKNYLMKIGEADLHPIIKRERSRLNIDEFLNIDAILEEVLVKILLSKLKAHLYRLMILESTSNGELRRLSENISQVRAMSAAELGFPEGTELPDSARMEQISRQLRKMQNHYSPLKKVQLLLRVLSLAVPLANSPSAGANDHSFRQQNHGQMGEFSPQTPKAHQNSGSSSSYYALSPTLSAVRHRTNSGSSSCVAAAALKHPPADELIRWLVYLLARSSTINCEIEAWYMWELLPQQVLNTGDASYFLSILFSAVHVLKHPESLRRLKNVELARGHCGGVHQSYPFADFMGSQSTLQDFDDSDLLLRVAILNEHEGTIEYHSFPILPKMNVTKLCRMIAHQFSVTNPEDYRLYLIFDDYESPPLEPTQIPHLLRSQMNETERPHHLFVYKRADVNISYPGQAVANFFGSNTTVLMNPPPLVVTNMRDHR
ncbi:hypothetical protein niasHS_011080 [Heterodera schachtii]|uniref:Protein sprint n=1 Tax=Heterodera schachtii TaxID=97005 RepID=A0ABD2IUI3_HETSC